MKSALFLLALGGVALADAPKPDPSRIAITVSRRGFEPGDVTVPAHKQLTLVFTRTTEATCAKSVIVAVDDKTTIEKPLPLDKAVEIPVTFPKPGKLSYACGMDMVKGTITVQ
jgi:plastocyanin domain-containing protein